MSAPPAVSSDVPNLTVVYRETRRPCAICDRPSDNLWHARKGDEQPSPFTPGVCLMCVANAATAFAHDMGASRAGRGEG